MSDPHGTATATTTRPGTTPPWRYALGMFGTSIPISMVRGSMILFYVDILGLDVRVYGAVMVVYAILDAVDNPVLGWLSDRTRTRWGRRRPWLVIGAPLLAAGLIGFFSTPDSLDGLALVVWFATFAVLTEAADSLLNANYGALLPELFPDEGRRASANALRQVFQLVALVISLAVTPLLTTRVLGTEDTTIGFQRTALIYAAIAVAVIVFMALGARENPDHAGPDRPRFFATWRTILTNRYFWQVGLASACYTAAMALVLAGLQLYVRYSLGLPVASAFYLQGTVIVVSVAGLGLWARAVRAHGAPRVWRWAFAGFAVSFVPLYLARDLTTALGAGVVVGACYAGMLATNDLVIARVLDDDGARHGQHREGLFLSAFGFFGRLNGVVTGLALASLGLLYGYYSGDDPGAHAGDAFRLYVCGYPFVLAAVGAVVARFITLPGEERGRSRPPGRGAGRAARRATGEGPGR